jgi:hypothetical protein
VSLSIKAEPVEFVNDSRLIRGFTPGLRDLFYRSLRLGSQNFFPFIAVRLLGFSQEKPEISPKTQFAQPG